MPAFDDNSLVHPDRRAGGFSFPRLVRRPRGRTASLLAAAALAATAPAMGHAQAASLQTLATFNGANGASPLAGLLADAAGNLFGTTYAGGTADNGTVYEIRKTSTGHDPSPVVLFSFDGTHGANPRAALIADAAGNLLGTTTYGGTGLQGTVFEIAKTAGGYAGTPNVLFSFDGSHGAYPLAGLLADAAGNLFGTTSLGGRALPYEYQGTVFEIAKTADGYASTPTVLFSFDYTNGSGPYGTLIADAGGNLFGTTEAGGASYPPCDHIGCGTVFQLAKTDTGYASTPTLLAKFDVTHGAGPYAGLVADAAGNLFGTTHIGGSSLQGTVFKIAKTADGHASTPTVLFSFDVTHGGIPAAGLIVDAAGNLFGTTYLGGASSRGTVFELKKDPSSATGYADTATVLFSFDGTYGAHPSAGLIADKAGNLYGTTYDGGASNAGTVFKVTGSGFVAFAGTPGQASCHGDTVSALAQQNRGMSRAAAALGFGSVQALQSAITAYCGG